VEQYRVLSVLKEPLPDVRLLHHGEVREVKDCRWSGLPPKVERNGPKSSKLRGRNRPRGDRHQDTRDERATRHEALT
jgi:hypothetical protein